MLVGGMAMGRAAAQRDMEMQQQSYQQGQQAQQVAQPPPQKDMLAELQKLGDLHQTGVLSDAEFAAAKQKLLS